MYLCIYLFKVFECQSPSIARQNSGLKCIFFFFPKIQPDGLFGRNSWNMLILEQEIKDCPDAGSKRKVLVRPRPSILSQTCQIQPNLRYWVANDLKKKKKN